MVDICETKDRRIILLIVLIVISFLLVIVVYPYRLRTDYLYGASSSKFISHIGRSLIKSSLDNTNTEKYLYGNILSKTNVHLSRKSGKFLIYTYIVTTELKTLRFFISMKEFYQYQY